MSDATDQRIRERGGDPACLHCQLAVLIGDWLDARPGDPLHGMQIAMGLAGVIGDLLEPCADVNQRMRCLDSVVREIGQHCGITIWPTQIDEVADTSTPGPPPKVH